MFVAQPIRRDGVALGIARASVPMTVVAAAASAARVRMAYGGLIALGIAAIVAGFLSLGILRPLRALAVAAKELGGGALAHRCPVASNDEIGDVARAMNEMAGRLEAMVGTLDQRNKDLRVVLDNVAQGLVTVDRQGKIAEERSRSIDRWFAAPPPGTRLWELFEGASPNVKLAFSMGWDQVFDGILPLERRSDLRDRMRARRRSGQPREVPRRHLRRVAPRGRGALRGRAEGAAAALRGGGEGPGSRF
jgi:HAMP domain-containing protein